MKRFRTLTLLLTVSMLLSLVACDEWTGDQPSAPSSPSLSDMSTSGAPLPSDLPGTNDLDPDETELPPSDETTETIDTTPLPGTKWTASFEANSILAGANQATVDASGAWTRWPADLITPAKLNLDLSAYVGAPKNERPLQDLTVILDPGHGGKDPGALGVSGDQTIYEKDVNLAIAMKTRSELEALGATVIMTREDDSWVSLYTRVAIAGFATTAFWEEGLTAAGLDTTWLEPINAELQKLQDINEDTVESGGRGFAQGLGVRETLRQLFDAQVQTKQIIYLSIHANSTDVSLGDKRGLQMYISTNQHIYESELSMLLQDSSDPEILPINPNYQAYDDAARLRLAGSLFGSITGLIPELKQSEVTAYAGNFAFLRELNLTSVLIETAFMSNSEDLAILLDPDKQAAFASGIADGVWRYFTSAS